MYVYIRVDIWIGVRTCIMYVCMYVCMFVWVYIYVCELAISMYMCIYLCICLCIYVYIHKGSCTNLRGCIECLYGRVYFMRELLTHLSQSNGNVQIKLRRDLKYFNFIVTLFKCHGDKESGIIYMSCLWVSQGSEVGNIRPCECTRVDRDTKKEWESKNCEFVWESDWS